LFRAHLRRRVCKPLSPHAVHLAQPAPVQLQFLLLLPPPLLLLLLMLHLLILLLLLLLLRSCYDLWQRLTCGAGSANSSPLTLCTQHSRPPSNYDYCCRCRCC
jgi:hypothetical protein